MTPFAAALLEAKRAGEPNAPKIPVTVVQPAAAVHGRAVRGRICLGLAFDPRIERARHPHAARDRAPYRRLEARSGAGHRPATDSDRLAALGEEGVLALVSDSTNAIRDGVSPSEGEVAKVLERLIAEAPQRVAVTTFASNVARIRAVAAAAQRAGRDVVVVGRAIRRSVDVARELGYLEGLPEFLDQETYAHLPRNKVVALMTGQPGRAARGARQDRRQGPRARCRSRPATASSSRRAPFPATSGR